MTERYPNKMKEKFNLRDWFYMGLASIPLFLASALAFNSCDEQTQLEFKREQQAYRQKMILNPYWELVNWAHTNNIVAGTCDKAYDSEITKFLSQRF
jgi:hypothetical protein